MTSRGVVPTKAEDALIGQLKARVAELERERGNAARLLEETLERGIVEHDALRDERDRLRAALEYERDHPPTTASHDRIVAALAATPTDPLLFSRDELEHARWAVRMADEGKFTGKPEHLADYRAIVAAWEKR